MERNFCGMGEVCLVGSLIDDDDTRTASKGNNVSQVCGSDAGDSWAISSRLSHQSVPGSDTGGTSLSSTAPNEVYSGPSPLSLEVQDLRSLLEIATRLLGKPQ